MMQNLRFFVQLLTVVFFALSTSISRSTAQSPAAREKFAIFARGGAELTSYGSGFGKFRGPAECAKLTSGSGGGFTGSIGFEMPLFSSGFLEFGIGLVDFSGKGEAISVFTARDTSSGVLSPVTLNTSLATTMRYIALRPGINFTLAEKLFGGPLKLNASLTVFLPNSPAFSQTESIVSPSSATFIYGGRHTQTRLIANGDISTAQTLFGLAAGIENLIPLSSALSFSQRIGADIMLNKAVSDADWNVLGLRAELGLRYAFRSTKPLPEQPPQPPPAPKPELPAPVRELSPALSITLKKVDVKGKEGRELIASPSTVNAVFFERNSAEIPAKYTQKNISAAMPSDAVEFHRYILPFVAKLLQENPHGKVEIYGATSGDDESEGLELARKRAASVQKALVTLGVAPDRIVISADIFPASKSSSDLAGGREENRRADIIVRNARLQEYVSKQNYAELSGTATFEIIAEDLSDNDIITVTSQCFTKPLTTNKSGVYTVPLGCRITETGGAYSLQIKANSSNIESSDFTLISLASIEKTNEEVKVDNFDAILRFDYNSDELSTENKELLRQMLEKIPIGTTILIYGSADALGSQQRNIQLEKNRATVTEQFIRSISGNKFIIRSAQETEKFSENTPEGRFLNRNMRIRLRKN